MDLKQSLKKIDLTDGESAIFLTLLRLGKTKTGKLIRETKFQSSAVYHILDSLIEKGLVSYTVLNNIKYFYAEQPFILEEYIKNKQEELKEAQNNIAKLLNDAGKISSKKEDCFEAKVFQGVRSVTTAFLECIQTLKKSDVIYAFTLSEYEGFDKNQAMYLINKIRDLRIKKGLSLKVIIDKKFRQTIGIEHERTPSTEVRYLPKDFTFPAVIHIYDNKVLIAVSSYLPFALVIENKIISKTFRNHFDFLWHIAKNI